MSEQSKSDYLLPDYGSPKVSPFFKLLPDYKLGVAFAAEKERAAARAAGEEVLPVAAMRHILAQEATESLMIWWFKEYTRACEAADKTALSVQEEFAL